MKARRVARELALLTMSQLSKKPDSLDDKTIEDLVLTAVRTLSDYAYSNLKNTTVDLLTIKESLDETELNDPVNLSTPMDSEMLPAQVTDTKTIREYADTMLDSAEYVLHAIEIVEMLAHIKQREVLSYSIRLIKEYSTHANEIEEVIDTNAKGWNIDRILKMDKNILSLALLEIRYFKDIPNGVAADEAVELAKKYSSEDSPKFINGILGQVIANEVAC